MHTNAYLVLYILIFIEILKTHYRDKEARFVSFVLILILSLSGDYCFWVYCHRIPLVPFDIVMLHSYFHCYKDMRIPDKYKVPSLYYI